jgi:hypothetical protein
MMCTWCLISGYIIQYVIMILAVIYSQMYTHCVGVSEHGPSPKLEIETQYPPSYVVLYVIFIINIICVRYFPYCS